MGSTQLFALPRSSPDIGDGVATHGGVGSLRQSQKLGENGRGAGEGAMTEYEIRLYRVDGTLSIIVATTAETFAEVENATFDLLQGDIDRAEIWHEKSRMAVVVPIRRHSN